MFQQNSYNQFHLTFLFSLLGYLQSLKPNIRMMYEYDLLLPSTELREWLLC